MHQFKHEVEEDEDDEQENRYIVEFVRSHEPWQKVMAD